MNEADQSKSADNQVIDYILEEKAGGILPSASGKKRTNQALSAILKKCPAFIIRKLASKGKMMRRIIPVRI